MPKPNVQPLAIAIGGHNSASVVNKHNGPTRYAPACTRHYKPCRQHRTLQQLCDQSSMVLPCWSCEQPWAWHFFRAPHSRLFRAESAECVLSTPFWPANCKELCHSTLKHSKATSRMCHYLIHRYVTNDYHSYCSWVLTLMLSVKELLAWLQWTSHHLTIWKLLKVPWHSHQLL